MERSEFLNLAARYAGGEAVTVMCGGIEYYPVSYTIEPTANGTWRHSVKLKDTKAADSWRYANLSDITSKEEANGDQNYSRR